MDFVKSSIEKVALCPLSGEEWMTVETWRALWGGMEADGLAKRVFYDGSITCERDWVRYMTGGVAAAFAIFAGPRVAGVVWLNGIDQRSAELHGFLFRWAWGRGRRLAPLVFRGLFGLADAEGPLFDSFLLKIPETNAMARNLARKCGGRSMGRLLGGWHAGQQRPVVWDVFAVWREDC